MQFRGRQVDQGRLEDASRPAERGDRAAAGAAAPPPLHQAAVESAAAHGARVCLRAQEQLLPARCVKRYLKLLKDT